MTRRGGHDRAEDRRDPPGSGFGAGGGAGPGAVAEALEGLARARAAGRVVFLEQLIRRTFDPRLVDAVTGRPTWLTQLLHSDRGRGVLFSLAEKHPDCLLITVAIQHAWQHGHADEVKALGPAAASYFSVFHELLADHFRDLIGAGDDEARLAEATGAIRTACCQSLATYLFAQMMLADLANGGDAGLGARASRAIARLRHARLAGAARRRRRRARRRRRSARRAAPGGVRRGRRGGGGRGRPAPGCGRLQAQAGHGALRVPPETLRKLRDAYLGDEETSAGADVAGAAARLPAASVADGSDRPIRRSGNADTPSTAPLRSPELLRALFDEAFRWDPNADPARNATARARCFDLIATATCGADEFGETRANLASVFEWCAGTTRGVPLALEEGSSPFLETVRHPVPAAGALAWVRPPWATPSTTSRCTRRRTRRRTCTSCLRFARRTRVCVARLWRR